MENLIQKCRSWAWIPTKLADYGLLDELLYPLSAVIYRYYF